MLNCWSSRPPNLPCSLRVIVVEKDLDGRLEVLSGFHVDSSSISFRKRDVRRNDSSVRRERCRRRHICEWEEVERRGGKEERKEKMEVGGKDDDGPKAGLKRIRRQGGRLSLKICEKRSRVEKDSETIQERE